MKALRVLVACEFSGIVRRAFAALLGLLSILLWDALS